jgi:hypothetical protein
VSVAEPAQPVWNFSPRFRSEFLPLGDARGSLQDRGRGFGLSGLDGRHRLITIDRQRGLAT